MNARIRTGFRRGAIAALLALLSTAFPAAAQDKKDKLAEPITKGQRVFTCGHSFHVWVPGIVADLAKKAEIPGSRSDRPLVDRRLARSFSTGTRPTTRTRPRTR